MRNYCRAFTVALLTASLCFAPLARATDGTKILSDCKTYIAFMDRQHKGEVDLKMAQSIGYCLGWVTGLVNGAVNVSYMLTLTPDSPTINDYSGLTREVRKNSFFCLPSDSNMADQWVRIVVSFMEENPKNLDKDAAVHALLAFRNAWPCKPTTSKQ